MKLGSTGGGSLRPRLPIGGGLLGLALLVAGQARADWHIKQVAYLNRGQHWSAGRVVPYRPSQDSTPLLVFHGGIPYSFSGVYFYRYVSMNRYRLVKVDTGNASSGFVPGNMQPWQAGDVNGVGPLELLASNINMQPSVYYHLAVLYAPHGQWLCPDSVAWSRTYDSVGVYGEAPFYITDSDQDGKKEIFVWNDYRQRAFMCENVGLNLFHIVWESPVIGGFCFAFGDLDHDSLIEFATADPYPNGWVKVLKCTGDDRYVLWDSVAAPSPNGNDVFAARNLDGSGRSVMFVSFINYSHDYHTYLYTFEPTQGTKNYQAFLVDSSFCSGTMDARSCCGDIDGDDREEILWSNGDHIRAYRWIGPHQFEPIWYWAQDSTSANITVYDVNGNGYSEIIESGGGSTHIFEIEAIRVLNPNRRVTLHPGDTCRIRWQTFNPPPCDSISLFLRSDSAWRFDTLIHGLPPTDTSWVWTVPDIRSDSCRIVAIAYGPGWQYDESDTCFRIAPVGVEEQPPEPTYETKLVGAFPNPLTDATSIRFELSRQSQVSIRICDVSGRTAATLAEGVMKPGVYHRDWEVAPTVPNGIYFLEFSAAGLRESRKLILTR